jgi:hypothetical protein
VTRLTLVPAFGHSFIKGAYRLNGASRVIVDRRPEDGLWRVRCGNTYSATESSFERQQREWVEASGLIDVAFKRLAELRHCLQEWHDERPCPTLPRAPRLALVATDSGYTYTAEGLTFTIDRIEADLLRRRGWRLSVCDGDEKPVGPTNEYNSLSDVYLTIADWRARFADREQKSALR